MSRTISLLMATGFVCLCHLSTAMTALSDELNGSTSTNNPNRIFTFAGEVKVAASYSKSLEESYYSTGFRLQAEFSPHEDIELIGRGYVIKAFDVGFAAVDDDNYQIDKLYLKWHNLENLPVAIEAGRLPTQGGNTTHIGLGIEKIEGELSNFTNLAIDGISIGIELPLFWSSEIKLYYGTRLEYGYEANDPPEFNDTDIYGLKWDIIGEENRKISIQSLAITNIYNVPIDTYFPNPLELAAVQQGLANGTLYQDPATGTYNSTVDGSVVLNNTYLDRTNLGNIYHTSLLFMDKVANLNYFLAGGWSHTEAKDTDELGISLLGDFWSELQDKDGYGFYAGIRYDLDDMGLKFGAEYNYGSKNWLSFSDKLATRGSVYEVYGIYDIPIGDALSKFTEVIIRLGYLHYDYEYTYSASLLGTPTKIDDLLNDPLLSQFYNPLTEENITYCSVRIYF